MVAYNNKKYYIDIVETKPSNAISIIETDCEVDFAPPLDYKEPEPVKPAVPASTEPTTGNALVLYITGCDYCSRMYFFLANYFVLFFQRLQLKNQSSSPSLVQEGAWMGSLPKIKMCWPHPLQSDKLMRLMVCSPQQPPHHRAVHRVRPQENLSLALALVEAEPKRLVFYNTLSCLSPSTHNVEVITLWESGFDVTFCI
jgi:hypothetical protein